MEGEKEKSKEEYQEISLVNQPDELDELFTNPLDVLNKIDDKLKEEIQKFVNDIFIDSQSISLQKKADFGKLVQDREARLLFAIFVDEHRVQSQRVSELTFYSLAQHFSIVLLECLLAEDFRPAKIIMNMMFTYYYEHNADQPIMKSDSVETFNNKSSSSSSISSLSAGNMLTRIGILRGSPSASSVASMFSSNKSSKSHGGSSSHHNESQQSDGHRSQSSVREDQDENGEKSAEKVATTKTYLYTLLKEQQIFKSIRFWTSAFYESVIIERKNHSLFQEHRDQECKISNEQRAEELELSKNITFGLLTSFIHNMNLIGLDRDLCREFLEKHSMIAGLTGDQLEMLASLVK